MKWAPIHLFHSANSVMLFSHIKRNSKLLRFQPVSANLTPTIRGQRPSTPTITMQDLATSTAITVASVAGARPLIQTTVAASSLAAGQKIAGRTAAANVISSLYFTSPISFFFFDVGKLFHKRNIE